MDYLLDTNILTALLKNNEKINKKLEEVRFSRKEVFISCITYYESKRGLIYVNATRQLSQLIQVSRNYRVLFLDDALTARSVKERVTALFMSTIIRFATAKSGECWAV